MGKQQVNTGKGNQTVNTNNVWDRIVALEGNGVPNLSGELNGVKLQLAEIATNEISITSLGAKGDGVTDAAPFIQQAEDMGKSIFFPSGVYRIASNIVKRNGVNWRGAGKESILLIDNSYNYFSDISIIKNENYGVVDTDFNALKNLPSWSYAYKNNGLFDTFSFSDLTFKVRAPYRVGGSASDSGLTFLNLMHTKDVILKNVLLDSDNSNNEGNCIFVFRGGNYNTIVENCEWVHDTNSNVTYGGSVVFMSRSTSDPIQNVIIRDNKITKKNGGDETIWLGANINAVNNVVIENNDILLTGSSSKASVIMLPYNPDTLIPSVTEPFNNVVIRNNLIETVNMGFSPIFLGYNFGSANFAMSGKVDIVGNVIHTIKHPSTVQVVSGITLSKWKQVNITQNKLNGDQDTGINISSNIDRANVSSNRISMDKASIASSIYGVNCASPSDVTGNYIKGKFDVGINVPVNARVESNVINGTFNTGVQSGSVGNSITTKLLVVVRGNEITNTNASDTSIGIAGTEILAYSNTINVLGYGLARVQYAESNYIVCKQILCDTYMRMVLTNNIIIQSGYTGSGSFANCFAGFNRDASLYSTVDITFNNNDVTMNGSLSVFGGSGFSVECSGNRVKGGYSVSSATGMKKAFDNTYIYNSKTYNDTKTAFTNITDIQQETLDRLEIGHTIQSLTTFYTYVKTTSSTWKQLYTPTLA